jgi:hypothetical protein
MTCWKKIANGTNNFKRAGIAFNPFLFIALIDAQVGIACVT